MSINANTIATRFRVARNFDMLVKSGIDGHTAAEIVKQHKNVAFDEIRISDDKVVVIYKTCAAKHSFDIPVAA